MTTLAISTVEPARAQVPTTSHYRFQFVPLTLGLTLLVAVMPGDPVDLATPKSDG